MALEGEPEKINTELTKNAVEIRQIIQDFPLCSTFKEIDEQNALGTNIKQDEISVCLMLFADRARRAEIKR